MAVRALALVSVCFITPLMALRSAPLLGNGPDHQDPCAGAVQTVQSHAADAAPQERPPWAPEGVPEIVWRLVDTAYVTEDDGMRSCLLDEAEREASALVQQKNTTELDARFSQAIVSAIRADRESGRGRIGAASRLRQQLDTILQLEPTHARARHMMGRLHVGVLRQGAIARWIATNLLGGGALEGASWEEAEAHLVFAHEHAPEVLQHHLELARLYQHTDRPEMVRPELEHVLEREPRSAMGSVARDQAREMLEQPGG